MSRGVWIRFILVLGLLVGCAALAVNVKPNLGLDLKGGAQFVFQAEGTEQTPANAENVDKTLSVLNQRVNALGVAESNVIRQGENRILVELPGVTSDEEAQEAEDKIGATAKLTIHEVVATAQPDAEPSKKDNLVLPSDQGDTLEVGPTVIEGEEVTGASSVQRDQSVEWVVAIDFNGKGGDTWADITGKAACNPSGDPKRRIAIVLDGEIISSPEVNTGVGCNVGIRGGSTDVTGSFTSAESKDLAALIQGGALPLELTAISDRLVGPSLGAAAIDASIEAGLIGLLLTGLFIIIVYRLVGLAATIALASYALLAYAMLVGLGSTLTLPGLAGFVLAIGMAIDANVLVFERAREEYAAYPSAGLRRALAVGFNKAWTAIIDSNVTTLLAAGLLFFLGSGPIKGFGVTLSIGVIASMISALIIARVLCDLAVANKPVSRRPMLSGLGDVGKVRMWLDRKDPDLMKNRAHLARHLRRRPGRRGHRHRDAGPQPRRRVHRRAPARLLGHQRRLRRPGARGRRRRRLPQGRRADRRDRELHRPHRRRSPTTRSSGSRTELEKIGGDVSKIDDQQIGASLGEELRNNALIAFGVAFLAQLLYLAVRFKWTFGVSAVVAMAHDVLLVVGIFAWLGKPIDGIFLAAAMTIVGLSVNDTVVVFDRVRERWHGSKPDEEFSKLANKAAIETVPRTVNTGLGSMFILAALAILGGDSLRDFAIALLVGLVVGTYSSVFMATPLLTYLQEKWPMSRVKKEKVVRTPEDSGAVV